jgi:DNA-binding GntR family transcriptional regulator
VAEGLVITRHGWGTFVRRDGGHPAPIERVAADLRRRTKASEWASGEALRSIAALAEHYGLSRATVAKAVRRLANDGLVEVVPQWGTFRT